jgi:hypothetical protein
MNLLLLSLALAAAPEPAVRLTAEPHAIWVEEGRDSRTLDFDLLIENRTDLPLDVDEVLLSVYDRAGRLQMRRFVDGNGTRPSIRTIDVAEVPAHATALVFNPFTRFDREIELARLVYEVHLSGKEGKPVHVAQVTVEPRAHEGLAPLRLPVAGRVLVYDGHDFYAHHRRWDYTIPGLRQLGFHTNFMRYSYDLVPVDEDGGMAKGDESRNESFPGFGQPVRAVAAGKVVAVRDTQPDDRSFDPGAMGGDTMRIWGNYVVIEHAPGEFGLYGHVQKGSAKVKVGDTVASGQPVAAIGAAGSSKFPHLHFEMQTGPGTDAEGLPSVFADFDRVLGARRVHVDRGPIETGDIVLGR